MASRDQTTPITRARGGGVLGSSSTAGPGPLRGSGPAGDAFGGLWPRRRPQASASRPGLDVQAPRGELLVLAALAVLPASLAHQVVVPTGAVEREHRVPSDRLAVHRDGLQRPLQRPPFAAWLPFLVRRPVGGDLEGVRPLGLRDAHAQLGARRHPVGLREVPPVDGAHVEALVFAA